MINSVNTTNLRIIVSIWLAALAVVLVTVCILFRGWVPTEPQITVLKGCGLLLFAMMGLDVAQFTAKRFSDATYAAAKNPTQPVSVDTPPAPAAAHDKDADAVPGLPHLPEPPRQADPVDALRASLAAHAAEPTVPVGEHVPGQGD